MNNFLKTRAFSLVEVTLSLGICSFCLIALVGVLPSGLTATANASRETEAMNVAMSLLADFQYTGLEDRVPDDEEDEDLPPERVLPSATKLYGFPSGGDLNEDQFMPFATGEWTVADGDGIYWISVRSRKSSGIYNFTVEVSWPAEAQGGNSKQGSVTVFGKSLSR